MWYSVLNVFLLILCLIWSFFESMSFFTFNASSLLFFDMGFFVVFLFFGVFVVDVVLLNELFIDSFELDCECECWLEVCSLKFVVVCCDLSWCFVDVFGEKVLLFCVCVFFWCFIFDFGGVVLMIKGIGGFFFLFFLFISVVFIVFSSARSFSFSYSMTVKKFNVILFMFLCVCVFFIFNLILFIICIVFVSILLMFVL